VVPVTSLNQLKGLTVTSTIQQDAREFGLHVKAGGWRLGLLVARNVINAGPGNRKVTGVTLPEGKVDATEFARQADTSAPRVLRYLRAWDAAAEADKVPRSADLTPGTELDLDVGKLGAWSEFYPPVAERPTSEPERRTAIVEQAEADGSGVAKTIDITQNQKALASAIKADPKTADTARQALRQFDAVQASENLARAGLTPMPTSEEEAQGDAMVYVLGELLKARDHLRNASRRMSEVSMEDREQIMTLHVSGIRRWTEVLSGQVEFDVDAAIEALLGGEPR
jgi:hypothetical protein